MSDLANNLANGLGNVTYNGANSTNSMNNGEKGAANQESRGVSDDDAMNPDSGFFDALPDIPVSAGAIILDRHDRLLVLKPTYKSGWTIPGGVMEADGESPWDACRREVWEETGLSVTSGRLVCVDTRPAKPGRKLGLRLLFHCGVFDDDALAGVRVQALEVSQHRLVPPAQALAMLRPAIRRRVAHGLEASRCRYLEDGHPVPGLSD